MPFNKKRASNFTLEEKQLLVDFVKENIKIIENKSVDTKLLKRKNDCWKRCAQTFHLNGFIRDASRLKDTYHRMKHHAKVTIKKYKQHSARAKNGHVKVDAPTDIDYAIMNMCPVDFKVAPIQDSADSCFKDEKMIVVKTEPVFNGDSSPEHPTNEVYVDEPEIILESTTDLSEPDVLGDSHDIKLNSDKEISKSEEAQIKYNLLKIRHETEMHNIKIKNLQMDEKRKAELHEKLLEEQNFKILLLKKQLNQL